MVSGSFRSGKVTYTRPQNKIPGNVQTDQTINKTQNSLSKEVQSRPQSANFQYNLNDLAQPQKIPKDLPDSTKTRLLLTDPNNKCNKVHEPITSEQSHNFVVVEFVSEETNDENIQNVIKETIEENLLLSSSTETALLKHFKFQCISTGLKYLNDNVQKYKHIVASKQPLRYNQESDSNNKNMWNSRNRILIDTDGDDVAFLSGSGSQ